MEKCTILSKSFFNVALSKREAFFEKNRNKTVGFVYPSQADWLVSCLPSCLKSAKFFSL